MTMPADSNTYNDDGTPRRRYEIDENESSGKPILRSSIGIVLLNGFVLIKSLLFPGEASMMSSPAAAKGSDSASKPLEPDTIASVEDLEALQPVGDVEEVEPIKRKGSSTLTVSEPVNFAPQEVALHRRSSGLPTAGNDNEALYGAQPGSNISIFAPNDAVSGGHSNSGGAGHSDSEDPDSEDGNDDDDDSPTRNRLPVLTSAVALPAAFANQSVTIALADLLRHASDPDGDTLNVRSITSSTGKIERQADGNFVYTPLHGDTSSASFSYLVSDGSGSVRQTAVMDLLPPKMAPIVGTATSDTILGTPESDIIYALGGDDIVIGRESGDVIYGGDGNDRLLGGDGDDVIYGEGGHDVIFAGLGNDRVFGGDGDDQIFGEEGQDVLLGEAGNDTISGGDDDDTISGGTGDDTLHGDNGHDLIMGDAGRDTIEGGDGDDTVVGGEDDDVVDAGSGDDTIVTLAFDGNDTYDGGDGSDTYDISATTADAVIDLNAGTAVSDEIGTDQILHFENARGGSGHDVIVANDSPNVLSGGAGNDVIDAGAGDDVIIVTLVFDGNDTYDGGEGSDTYDISATAADAMIDLDAGTASSDEIGTDQILHFENARGGSGDDVIVANESPNDLAGGDGNDMFVFGSSLAIGTGSGYRDRILDFEVGDRIDLDDISEEFADSFEDLFEEQGIKKFVLIREQDEFSRPGQMKMQYEERDDGSTIRLLAGNTDYDAGAEFEIEFLGSYEFSDRDFYWHT